MLSVFRSSQNARITLLNAEAGKQLLSYAVELLVNCMLPFVLTLAVVKGTA